MSFPMKNLFIHINKCGGTSIKKVLSNKPGVVIPKNDNLIKMSNSDLWSSYNKFTIIRNPYSRILSLHGMLNRQNKKYNLDDVLKIITNDNIAYKNTPLNGNSYIKRHGLKLTHPHYSIYKNGEIIVDHIFKLENINFDWVEIQKMLPIKDELPILNKSKFYSEKDFNLFNKDQIILINEYFKDDFITFNYNMI